MGLQPETCSVPITETVSIDESQFPEAVQNDLLQSLRERRIRHKFHYESYRQAQKWLALHEAYSPARVDPNCAEMYDQSFAVAADLITAASVRVVGLGCGGGQKDARLLQLLARRGLPLSYLPCDSSVPLVLTAQHAAEVVAPGICSDPLVCDLATCASLSQSIDRVAAQTGRPSRRIVTFFGMIPNFEPNAILPRLSELMAPGDWLLLSANLAPGLDYAAGVKSALTGYDNRETREWLSCFLFDIGIERDDGQIRFATEDAADGYKQVVADFHFSRRREIEVLKTRFDYAVGEQIRLFYSYRYQAAHVESLLRRHQMELTGQWVTRSGEEGVFLCRRHS
jgi:L-histidine N-alpha-methyltransferase